MSDSDSQSSADRLRHLGRGPAPAAPEMDGGSMPEPEADAEVVAALQKPPRSRRVEKWILAILLLIGGAAGAFFYLWPAIQLQAQRSTAFAAHAGGDYHAACVEFASYLNENPNDAGAVAHYALCKFKIGDTAEAKRQFARVAEYLNRNPELLYYSALSSIDEPEKGVAALNTILQSDPEDAAALFLRGFLNSARNPRGASEDFLNAEELARANPDEYGPKIAEAHTHLVRRAGDLLQPSQPEAIPEKTAGRFAVEVALGWPAGFAGFFNAYQPALAADSESENAAAEAAVVEAEAQMSPPAIVRFHYSLHLIERREYKEAERALQLALREAGGDSVRFAYLRGLLAAHKGDYAESAELFNKAAESAAADDQRMRFNAIAAAWMAESNEAAAESAIAAYRKALETQPNSAAAQNNLGYLLILTGEYESAAEPLAAAQAGLAQAPWLTGAVYLNQAALAMVAGKYDEAKALLKEAGGAAATPEGFYLRAALAADSESGGEEALAILEEAKKAAPEAAAPWLLMAEWYNARALLPPAIDQLEAARLRVGDDLDILWQLSALRAAAGDSQQAEELRALLPVGDFRAKFLEADQLVRSGGNAAAIYDDLASTAPPLARSRAAILLAAAGGENAAARLRENIKLAPARPIFRAALAHAILNGDPAQVVAEAEAVRQLPAPSFLAMAVAGNAMTAADDEDGGKNMLSHAHRAVPQALTERDLSKNPALFLNPAAWLPDAARRVTPPKMLDEEYKKISIPPAVSQLLAARRLEDAMAAWARMSRLSTAAYDRGVVRLVLQQYGDAVQDFRRALGADFPEAKKRLIYGGIGIALVEGGRPGEAGRALDLALEGPTPYEDDYRHYRGRALAREGLVNEARTQFEKNIAASPFSADNYFGLAQTYERVRDFSQARAVLLSLARARPQDARVYDALARQYEAAGFESLAAAYRRMQAALKK